MRGEALSLRLLLGSHSSPGRQAVPTSQMREAGLREVQQLPRFTHWEVARWHLNPSLLSLWQRLGPGLGAEGEPDPQA